MIVKGKVKTSRISQIRAFPILLLINTFTIPGIIS